jgi:hypothetical protein
MRASGQTTRLIDEAIQYLFTKGQIYLLKKTALSKANYFLPEKEKLFVDPDHKGNNIAQNNFIYRVMKRLEFEHSESHKIKTISKDYIHVTILNPYP